MLKRRGFVLIVISLVLALGAAWIARGWVQARLNSGPKDPGMQVVVAAMEIPFGTTVEARHLRVITLPSGTPLGDHFQKPAEVVGQIAVQKVISGEILLKGQFASHASGSTLAALLQPQMRAITVRVDDVVGVAGFLLPGNYVDVVAARVTNQHAETETVLRALKVLAVDQTASQDKDAPVVVRAVTLEVTPQQAEVLVKARAEGSIQLTLRGPKAIDLPEPRVVASPPPAPKRVIRRARVLVRPSIDSAVTIIRGTNVQHAPSST